MKKAIIILAIICFGAMVAYSQIPHDLLTWTRGYDSEVNLTGQIDTARYGIKFKTLNLATPGDSMFFFLYADSVAGSIGVDRKITFTVREIIKVPGIAAAVLTTRVLDDSLDYAAWQTRGFKLTRPIDSLDIEFMTTSSDTAGTDSTNHVRVQGVLRANQAL